MARQFEAAAPLDFGLGVRTTILVVFKLKRGRVVLPRQAPWRGQVVLLHLPLWHDSLTTYLRFFRSRDFVNTIP
jgi:hypothetical protein